MLKELGARPERVSQINRLAATTLGVDDLSGHGILVAGTVSEARSQGGIYGAAVRLTASTETVVVMSKRVLPPAGSEVLILGSVITDPAENFAGYQGSKSLLIWTGVAIALSGQ